uniref:5'-nucleotidase, cytosolic IA n=1 Tax=Laticauda laticaudata TaxID=8630 RepID=A0A8C5RG76_LATLA
MTRSAWKSSRRQPRATPPLSSCCSVTCRTLGVGRKKRGGLGLESQEGFMPPQGSHRPCQGNSFGFRVLPRPALSMALGDCPIAYCGSKATARHHHCCVLPSPVPYGRRAEDLHRAGCGGLREVSAGARGGALPARSSLSFCQGLFCSCSHRSTLQRLVPRGRWGATCGHFPRDQVWGFSPSCSSAHPQAPCGPWRAGLPPLLEKILHWVATSEPFLSDDPLSECVASWTNCSLSLDSQALESVNCQLRELFPDSEELFDIVLVTNNHAQVGVRLINSINHYNLFIERFCMTGGNSPICYLKAYHTNLYLSSDCEKVSEAIEEGIAAATIFTPKKDVQVSEKQLRVAFDGDAVLFSDESEQIVKAHGLDKFFEHEKTYENKPLAQGPLKGFLEALGKLQKKFYTKGLRLECPIRTYLVTARSAASSGARALKTLRSWGLETDEALFLAGAPKGPLLEKIRPHIFFDDQMFHVEGAKEMGTIAAHVPYGVAQKYKLSGQRQAAQDERILLPIFAASAFS